MKTPQRWFFRSVSRGVAIALLPLAASAEQPTAAAPASPGYSHHAEAASKAAVGVARNILNLCTLPAPRAPGAAPTGTGNASVPFGPGKVFDNLYFVGLRDVSAWAVSTSEGIILIDALNDAQDAEQTIVPGLRAVGLDPAQIKYLIITHGHADHYGGATYIADHFHPRVIASETDWNVMYGPRLFPVNPLRGERPIPKRDMSVADGQALTLGDTTITFYITPGHTPGTLSLILPVRDRGTSHVAALWGGTAFNFPPVAANFDAYAASAKRFGEVARKAGVDVLLSNHGAVDATTTKLPLLQARGPQAPNPFVVGPAEVASFFTVAGECAQARAAAL